MEKLVKEYRGDGKLIFDKNQIADVKYTIHEYEKSVPDGLGGYLPVSRDRRGKVSHAKGHPDWHPILSLHPGPFTLVIDDGQKLSVFIRDSAGNIQATGNFF